MPRKCISPSILALQARYRLVVKFTPQLNSRKEIPYSMNRRLVGPQKILPFC
jgi:hypothetical protein